MLKKKKKNLHQSRQEKAEMMRRTSNLHNQTTWFTLQLGCWSQWAINSRQDDCSSLWKSKCVTSITSYHTVRLALITSCPLCIHFHIHIKAKQEAHCIFSILLCTDRLVLSLCGNLFMRLPQESEYCFDIRLRLSQTSMWHQKTAVCINRRRDCVLPCSFDLNRHSWHKAPYITAIILYCLYQGHTQKCSEKLQKNHLLLTDYWGEGGFRCTEGTAPLYKQTPLSSY